MNYQTILQPIYAVINILQNVTVATYVYQGIPMTMSLLELLEVIFGVNVVTSLFKHLFNKNEEISGI